MRRILRLLSSVTLFAVLLLLASKAIAQTDWCVSPDGSPVGCVELKLNPAALTGDFYSGDVLLAAGQNPGRLVLPPGTHAIQARNIQSSEAGFGVLFKYDDAQANVVVTEGKTRTQTVSPKKVFIRGTLNLTCDIRNATSTDILACNVTIDGVPQPQALLAGQKADYYLDPGAHEVIITLAGDSATMWTPPTQTLKTTISAGRTAFLRPRFDKMGYLTLALNQPGVVADFYLDGVLIAQQAATTNLWVTPNKNHKVEAKNATDPAANGVYRWKDRAQNTSLGAGQSRTVTFALTKEFLKGFFELTCTMQGLESGQVANCGVSIDGVAAASVPANTKMVYPLDPGAHTVTVTASPAGIWTKTDAYTYPITIRAGQTTRKTATWKVGQGGGSGGGNPNASLPPLPTGPADGVGAPIIDYMCVKTIPTAPGQINVHYGVLNGAILQFNDTVLCGYGNTPACFHTNSGSVPMPIPASPTWVKFRAFKNDDWVDSLMYIDPSSLWRVECAWANGNHSTYGYQDFGPLSLEFVTSYPGPGSGSLVVYEPGQFVQSPGTPNSKTGAIVNLQNPCFQGTAVGSTRYDWTGGTPRGGVYEAYLMNNIYPNCPTVPSLPIRLKVTVNGTVIYDFVREIKLLPLVPVLFFRY